MNGSSVSSSALRFQARGLIDRIISALLEEGYRQDKAYRIAFSQAEEWAAAQKETKARQPVLNYHVTPHPMGWVIRQPSSARPSLVFETREEAIQLGQKLAQDTSGVLIIHRDDGGVQSRRTYH